MTSLSIDISDHVATVVVDRPPVNAVDSQVLGQIRDVFRGLGDDPGVRVAVFTGAGSRAFIGGADLNVVDQLEQNSAPSVGGIDRYEIGRDAMWAIYDCAVPVIAAVNGPAVGAGLALAAVCDIIIAADTAWFSTPEINVGLLGASAHLTLLVGRHRARELYFTGESISASELHRLGAIREVVPLAELHERAGQLARQLAQKSPIALRMAKEAMSRTEFMAVKEAYRIEQDYTARLLLTDDAKEARRAYLEKRPPVFTDR
jgi:enoyl-CoA hydratase